MCLVCVSRTGLSGVNRRIGFADDLIGGPSPPYLDHREHDMTDRKLQLGVMMSGGGRTLALLVAIALCLGARPVAAADSFVVGSKNFAESRLLAEIFAQLIEERTDLVVELSRRQGDPVELLGMTVRVEELLSPTG